LRALFRNQSSLEIRAQFVVTSSGSSSRSRGIPGSNPSPATNFPDPGPFEGPVSFPGLMMNPTATRDLYRVYVLRNAEGRGYIGVSSDINVRLDQHNQGLSKWTKGKGPWTVEWTSTELSLGEARCLENRMKRQKGGYGLATLMSANTSSGSSSRSRGIPGSNPSPATNFPDPGPFEGPVSFLEHPEYPR